jgi:hypothetical protein
MNNYRLTCTPIGHVNEFVEQEVAARACDWLLAGPTVRPPAALSPCRRQTCSPRSASGLESSGVWTLSAALAGALGLVMSGTPASPRMVPPRHSWRRGRQSGWIKGRRSLVAQTQPRLPRHLQVPSAAVAGSSQATAACPMTGCGKGPWRLTPREWPIHRASGGRGHALDANRLDPSHP